MGKPCIVPLFNGFKFDDFNPRYFKYHPICEGPWSKVVFEGSFNVTQGIQFDRTVTVTLGRINIYFGTTLEPSNVSSKSWTVQRDLTEYSSLFHTNRSGRVDLYNVVNSAYTSFIYGTGVLHFYPVKSYKQAPKVADRVYPLGNEAGGTVSLFNSTDQLTATFKLPSNIERVYLDVFAQSQSSDEFWYSCVPSKISDDLQTCSNTAFRETEISINGQPAGVAPIFPWIYTGDIDPNLWAPIPSVQTLNFKPYRVDLTPFAGVLSNNKQSHQIALRVYNCQNYFSVVASLLVYLDHGSKKVTGSLVKNDIGTPRPPVIKEHLTHDSSGNITKATILTTTVRTFTLSGYVNTSHGQVFTTVSQTIDFSNEQKFVNTATQYTQNITQITNLNSITKTLKGNKRHTPEVVENFIYPLTLDYTVNFLSEDAYEQIVTVKQSYQKATASGSDIMSLCDTVGTTATLVRNGSRYTYRSSGSYEYLTITVNGKCTSELITSTNGSINMKKMLLLKKTLIDAHKARFPVVSREFQ